MTFTEKEYEENYVTNKDNYKYIRFNKIYKGEWYYNLTCGVGLKITGLPTDEVTFMNILYDYSCNPVATQRVLQELKNNGVKYTTLMSGIDFNNLHNDLEKINVKIEIIPPLKESMEVKLNNGEKDRKIFQAYIEGIEKLDENEVLSLKKDYDIFKENVEKLQIDNFSYYGDNPHIVSKIPKIKKSYGR